MNKIRTIVSRLADGFLRIRLLADFGGFKGAFTHFALDGVLDAIVDGFRFGGLLLALGTVENAGISILRIVG